MCAVTGCMQVQATHRQVAYLIRMPIAYLCAVMSASKDIGHRPQGHGVITSIAAACAYTLVAPWRSSCALTARAIHTPYLHSDHTCAPEEERGYQQRHT